MRKIPFVVAAVLVVVGLLIQLIPYGRDHSIPPVNDEPVWPGPEARAGKARLFRLPQQPDSLALVQRNRASLLARLSRCDRRSEAHQFLGLGPARLPACG